ncbi:hypothetical protein F4818DRAFT_406858 [Hypoxylon cercidicola]|nr:hypothetical protein F4818DRAFT_406858 [Hypoxylon cercidicola]
MQKLGADYAHQAAKISAKDDEIRRLQTDHHTQLSERDREVTRLGESLAARDSEIQRIRLDQALALSEKDAETRRLKGDHAAQVARHSAHMTEASVALANLQQAFDQYKGQSNRLSDNNALEIGRLQTTVSDLQQQVGTLGDVLNFQELEQGLRDENQLQSLLESEGDVMSRDLTISTMQTTADRRESEIRDLREQLRLAEEAKVNLQEALNRKTAEAIEINSEREQILLDRETIRIQGNNALTHARNEAEATSRRDQGRIEDLQNSVSEFTIGKQASEGKVSVLERDLESQTDKLRHAQAAAARYLAADARELASSWDSWADVIDSVVGANYIAPPAPDADVPTFWTVVQPWRATVPFHSSAVPPGSSITSLLVQLYRRISTSQLDGLAFLLLERIARRSALTESKGGEGFLDGPLRILLKATIRMVPPAQSLDAEMFCLALDRLAILLQSTRGFSLPESEQLRGMLQQCASYEIFRDVTVEPEAAESFCLDRGIVGNGFGLIKLRRDRAALVVNFEDLSLRLVDSERSGFHGDDHGIFQSPLGDHDDIVVEITSGVHLGWWFRVTT